MAHIELINDTAERGQTQGAKLGEIHNPGGNFKTASLFAVLVRMFLTIARLNILSARP